MQMQPKTVHDLKGTLLSDIVLQSNLRSECRHVLNPPRETSIVPFGVRLDAARSG